MITTASQAETTLYPIKGKPIAFSELKGKWVFINYWASWCKPCLEEIPEFNQFYKQHKKENIALFAVNYDMLPKEAQQQLIADYHIRYPLLLDDPATALDLGEIRGVPITFVFNPEGQLFDTLYGTQTLQSLNQFIKKVS